jgi:peptide methionine sulfoxide reductase msrA/msrB
MVILKKEYINILIIIVVLLIGYLVFTGMNNDSKLESESLEGEEINQEMRKEVEVMPNYKNSKFKEIYLAGGCFWGVEAYFDKILGVEYTEVGYANGKTEDTSYQEIDSTGHAETVRVVYDPEVVELEEILEYYFKIIDPTILNRQGNDIGTQYRTGIFYKNEDDEQVISNFIESIKSEYDSEIVTEVEPLENFVIGEEYHQDYLEKNPNGYCHINLSDIPNRKPEINPSDYEKPSEQEIKEKLTEEEYEITQGKGTEPPFKNEYNDNKAKGIYVDIVTGQPLFSSRDKYDSGSGWPSFTKPIDKGLLRYLEDKSIGMERIEVLSISGDTHLGHVFNDGPEDEGGLRYCMNSGSLRFIPLEKMDEEGYGDLKVYVE